MTARQNLRPSDCFRRNTATRMHLPYRFDDDNLASCKAGVSGLRGQAGVMANDRRSRLVEHSIEAGIVGSDDLELLPLVE